MASAQDLPLELTRRIFEWYIGPPGPPGDENYNLARRQRPVILTHVCGEWRAAALADPYLWTDVQLNGRSELYFSFLQRSKHLLVDLTIMARGKRAMKGVTALLTRKVGRTNVGLERVRSIHIFVYNKTQAPDILYPMQMHSLPSLRTLRIHLSTACTWWNLDWTLEDNHHCSSPLLANPVGLETVILTGIMCFHCVPSRTSLKTLELHRPTQVRYTSALDYVLPSFPQLETFIVGRLALLPGELEHWRSAIKRSCTCFLRDLLLENLEYVEVTGESWDAIPHLVRPLKRASALKHTGGDSKQFTLLLNGLNVTSYEELSGKVAKYLPSTHLIHLHLIPKDPWTIEQAVAHWEMKENFRSITCYIPEAQHPDFINRTSTESDAPSCQINGYIPLVVYPNLGESSGARKTLPVAASVRTNGIPQLDARAPFLDPQVMEEEFGDAETEMERDCYDSFEDHIDYDIKSAQWFESSEDYVDQAMDLEAWATSA
ncbi:hypothetical protein DFP72DRAFT_884778 [Ephemerocybe angulata]|uniref:F-box domain-containing protein n=1 Tax=Ephemerocybe angulata TaxID=980116 RepID=A0A8H6I6S2_9AGAR|nr:hypothetical protein DFP72DRAFT_884778 [Tulosesus angulatus]